MKNDIFLLSLVKRMVPSTYGRIVSVNFSGHVAQNAGTDGDRSVS